MVRRVALPVSAALVGVMLAQGTEVADRGLTPVDVVRAAVVGDPFALRGFEDPSKRVAVYSPHHTRLAVMLRRGDPEANRVVGTILVFSSGDLGREDPPFEVVAQFASGSNYSPIARLRWLDEDRLMFAAANGLELPAVRVLNVRTRQLATAAQPPDEMIAFDADARGERMIFSFRAPARRYAQDPAARRHGTVVTDDHVQTVMDGSSYLPGEPFYRLAIADATAGRMETIAAPDPVTTGISQVSPDEVLLSPDGRFALVNTILGHWPATWADYVGEERVLRDRLRRGDPGAARQYAVLDLARQSYRRLVEAPLPAFATPVWIDGGHVVLVGGWMPLEGTEPAERSHRAEHRAIIDLDPATGRVDRVADLPPQVRRVVSAEWDDGQATLNIHALNASGAAMPLFSYRRADGRWSPGVAVQPDTAPEILLRQSPNDPPVLIARNAATGREVRLLDPNPQFARIRFGRVEPLEWTTADGATWSGGLYYPPDWVPGQRLPLVVDPYTFSRVEFSLVGTARGPFAARPLAAAGLMVLQMVGVRHDFAGTPKAGPFSLQGLEAAIDLLDRRSLIDPAKVGLIGFSASCYNVKYALTHSKRHFAAAIVADGVDLGYLQYTLFSAKPYLESVIGAPPFGSGLDVWQRESPGFNLDRVRTPLRIEAHTSLLGEWEWYAGLKRLGRPVEFYFFPEGAHHLVRPSERIASMQATVDWMDFWLQGRERTVLIVENGETESLLSAQYERWRRLREIAQSVLEPGTPLTVR